MIANSGIYCDNKRKLPVTEYSSAALQFPTIIKANNNKKKTKVFCVNYVEVIYAPLIKHRIYINYDVIQKFNKKKEPSLFSRIK